MDDSNEAEHNSPQDRDAPDIHSIASEECPTSSSTEPAFNPFAVRSTPISVGHVGDSTFKPTSLRRRVLPSQSDKPTISVDHNPIAASLLTSLVPPPPPPPEEDVEDFDQDEDEVDVSIATQRVSGIL